MRLLLCSATEFEISDTIRWIKDQNLEVDVLVAGIGLMSTAYHLTKKLSWGKPGLVLQAGVAGCFDETFPLGEVVAVKSERVGDLGVRQEGSFHSLADLGLATPNDAPWQQGVLVNPNPALSATGLACVAGVSVNQISTDVEQIALYKHSYGAVTESMEGAALHYVCLCERVPFLQIRALSNYVGERNKSNWRMKPALEKLNQTLRQIINKQMGS
jgi:futalosine hydrolase